MARGTRPSFYVKTFGCQMNKHDSERIAGLLSDKGYVKASNPEDADIIIYNTCSVRESAEMHVVGQLNQLYGASVQSDKVVVVTGCMAQSKKEEIFDLAPSVDLVVGSSNLRDLDTLIEAVRVTGEKIVAVSEPDGSSAVTSLPIHREVSFKAWVPISYGCSNFCSYCIVPYVRGPEVSRPFEEIVREAKEYARSGVVEITLLGQNVNSYRYEDKTFVDVLEAVSSIEGIRRLRFVTSHPKDFDKKIVELAVTRDNICSHFHLPMQSGSNRILAAMNRGYTRERYFSLVEMIRSEIPQASITTDIIVGFPTETREDFEDTLDALETCQFDQAFTFIYSPRRGTKAAEMADDVSHEEKLARLRELVALQDEISKKRNELLVGSALEVLVDGRSRKGNMMCGRTDTNKVVNFEGSVELMGRFVNVNIVAAGKYSLRGKVIS